MIEELRPHAERLLRDRSIALTFVDVGARNGVLELRHVAPFVRAWGFEPNPDEFEKLVTGSTDLARLGNLRSPAYQSLQYRRMALGNRNGLTEFYVTPGPGAAGVLEPDVERLREIKWKGREYQESFGEDIFAHYTKIEVPIRTLDSFADEEGIGHVDYLKIDVEGFEFEVLQGALSLLPTIGVIRVEVCFIPFRKEQKLFSHVDLLLREHGFDLLTFEIEPAQIGYKARTTPVEYIPSAKYPDRYGQPLSCDAIYVNRGIANPERSVAQAVVLLERHYLDEAAYILRERGQVVDQELLEKLRTIRVRWIGGSQGQQLRAIGYQGVDKAVGACGAIARLVRRLRR